ncbi:hypothetical protein JW865_07600 [Candidatus Bathyarchaeota archaeon]|nr:hypothetical protein [Candidatus Bathyarchaeota archaeon]
MPICDICGMEVDEVFECCECEAKFCEECGDKKKKLCYDCLGWIDDDEWGEKELEDEHH